MNSNPLPHTPFSLINHHFLVSASLAILNNSYEWNHAVFGLVWLTLSYWAKVPKFLQLVAYDRTTFFLKRSNKWHIYHISSSDWHLSCFHLLVTVNNVSVNMERKISLWELTFAIFNKYPEGQLLDHMEVLELIFEDLHIALHFGEIIFQVFPLNCVLQLSLLM